MAALFLRGKGEPYNRLYMLFCGTVLLWCGSQILVLLAENVRELYAAYLVGNIGICFVGSFWLYFAVAYTGKKVHGFWRCIPFFLSLAHYLLVLTNPLHRLYYPVFTAEKVEHGIFFYTNVAMTYTFVICGAILLYRHMEKGSMAKTVEYLSDARTLTSEGLRQLRESINDLRREASYELVTQGITMLASQVKEIPVEVTVRGEDGEKYSHLSRVLYDTTCEAITNALKYADASRIDIVIRFHKDSVELVIGDDGKGCDEISENNGIRGIRERVEHAGGTVRFTSSAGEGFLINVKVPVE
jgi:hypothetical protein